MSSGVEREVKLAAPADVELPGFDGAIPGLVATARPPQVLDAVYWDTPDLRLIRSGVSLRHRTRDGADGTWTVKVPAGGGVGATGALVRTETDLPGPAGRPLTEAVRLVAAHARAAELVPVARLVSTRTKVDLAISGSGVGELADDLVEVHEGGAVVARFREIEIEVTADVGDADLDVLVGLVRAAGAGAPDPTPKIARALGPRALGPPDLRVPDLRRDLLPGTSTAAEAVAASLAVAAGRVLASHHVAAAAADPAALRTLRAAVRRASDLLVVAGPLVDETWATTLRGELRWVVGGLAEVRRLDARLDRLARAARSLSRPADLDHAAALSAAASAARAAAVAPVLDLLGSDRYRATLELLVDGARDLPATARADRPAVAEGRRVVRAQWRPLRSRVDAAGGAADVDGLRRDVRRVRVGADLVAAVDGSGAARFAAALADAGAALSLRRDAQRSAEWLRGTSIDRPAPEAMVAGLLVAHEERSAAKAEERWRHAWDRATHPKAQRWLT